MTRTVYKVVANLYRDSVALMTIAAEVAARDGIATASLVMATEANLAMLGEAGLLEGAPAVGPNDLLVVVAGENGEAVDAALAAAVQSLDRSVPAAGGEVARSRPRGLAAAVAAEPDANLALISTPGAFAGAEAMKALRLGLDVMLFSDNVDLADEVMLKSYARKHGLMVMGPDCGTAIIDGLPLGFANAVRRGHIGIVAASGTGSQEVACQIDRRGRGISQAYGCGGRDFHAAIGATTALQALDKLAADPDTGVIVLISKPPEPEIAEYVLARAAAIQKPVVVDFLGLAPGAVERPGVHAAATLVHAAELAVALETGATPKAEVHRASEETPVIGSGRRSVRGLFSGGTLCHEAMALLGDGQEHAVVDLGSDMFTRGRPHPMIDLGLRNARIVTEAADAETAVILLDVVLGHGAHPDPASEIAAAIAEARAVASGEIAYVASVCGTEDDPQGRSRQEATLRAAGVVVADSNAEAARWAAAIVERR